MFLSVQHTPLNYKRTSTNTIPKQSQNFHYEHRTLGECSGQGWVSLTGTSGWIGFFINSNCNQPLPWLNSWARSVALWLWIILGTWCLPPRRYLVASAFKIGCEESLSSLVQKEMFSVTKSASAVSWQLWMSFCKTDSFLHFSKVEGCGQGKLEMVCSLVLSTSNMHSS